MLPGGPVGHGEDPAAAVARWAASQTGAPPTVRHPVRVVTDLRRDGGWPAAWRHVDTIVFAGTAVGGDWVDPAELPVPLRPALGLPAEPMPGLPRVAWSAVPARDGRRQRFAAYGLVSGPDDEVLLTLIAPGFPGAGLWHLPGGGTDFGESAEAALRREIVEETAQDGVVGPLLGISHRHHTQGMRGRSVDWHGVRAVYAVRVERPTTPRVLEEGGSTAAASWFSVAQARDLPLTEVAHAALARH